MTTKADFTEEEWFTLINAPSMVGSAVATAGKSGVMGTMREMMANIHAIMAAKTDYPDSELLQSLTEQAVDKDAAKADVERMRDTAMARMKELQIKNPDQLAEQALSDVRSAMSLIGERGSAGEASDYSSWLQDIANSVAEAAKEGGFLGFGGERVSDKEAAFISSLNSQLAEGGSSDKFDF